MLVHLNIRNFALIDRLTLEPGSGLNILTGETGTGKTIVLDAIGLVLGERASTDFIRSGSDKAIVQGVFKLDGYSGKEIDQLLQTWDIPIEEDGSLILTREISSGKSIAKINDQVVTLTKLKDIGKRLVDIHGQHDHQSLLNVDKHLDLLDAFGGEEVLSVRTNLYENYKELQLKQKQLAEIIEDPIERARKLELLEYQKKEIEEANLSEQEEQELYDLRKKLLNLEKIRETISFSYSQLYEGNDQYPSVIDTIGEVLSKLSTATEVDSGLIDFYNQIEQAMIQIEETSRELSSYLDDVDSNTMELQEVEDRIGTYNELKRKYGSTVSEIHDYYRQVNSDIDYLESTEVNRQELEQEKEQLLERINAYAKQLSQKRVNAKDKLEEMIHKHLKQLAMEKVRFSVEIKEVDLNPKGKDKAEFMFSPNIGEPLKPLSKIASGGEIARVMLALKSVLSEVDEITTLIFDEVDIGISGTAAQKVSDKLKKLSSQTQILCVTHLPQVASKADHHFKLFKNETNGRTVTNIETLTNDQRIEELAKMIDGETPSNTSLKHAKKMLFG